MSGEFSQSYFSLKGKTAVLTGATGILGRHFARGFAASGADLVLVDLKQSELADLSSELKEKYGVRTLPFACDIAKPEQVKELTKRSVAEFKRIDILHNNAATKTDDLKEFFAPTEDFSLEAWRKVMSVNLDGMFLVAQSVGAQMVRQKVGSIIQTASIYGVVGPDQRVYKGSEYMGMEINTPAVYSASKAGVVGLTKYLAALWGSKGVRVNTLVPGGVFSGQNDTFVKNYSARVPLARMAEAHEMVGPLIFLASDASSYMNGHTLMVDGGLCAW